jgi:putative glutamine amidotransferase
MYGETTTSERVTTCSVRTDYEVELCRLVLKNKLPLLGICAGEQLLNVVMGGSLIQHIPDTIPNCLPHEQSESKNIPTHSVKVNEASLLYEIVGCKEFMVNTTHHQAVARPGKGVVVNAIAPDGVIEGIEIPDHPFCMGVQWHPEYLATREDHKIFEYFVKSCR